MTLTCDIALSREDIDNRFDLPEITAKEYAVFLADLQGKLLSWNTAAERIFGYQSNEIIGMHFSRLFPPENTLAGQSEYELRIALAERKDGRRFLCHAVVRRLLDVNRNAWSFVIVTFDLTESDTVYPERRRAKELAARTLELTGSAFAETVLYLHG